MTAVAFTPGRCCVPNCSGAPKDSAICTRCWFDFTEEERAAVRLASESPFDPRFRLVEMGLALQAAAALFKRRRRKEAQRRLKRIRAAIMRRAA